MVGCNWEKPSNILDAMQLIQITRCNNASTEPSLRPRPDQPKKPQTHKLFISSQGYVRPLDADGVHDGSGAPGRRGLGQVEPHSLDWVRLGSEGGKCIRLAEGCTSWSWLVATFQGLPDTNLKPHQTSMSFQPWSQPGAALSRQSPHLIPGWKTFLTTHLAHLAHRRLEL